MRGTGPEARPDTFWADRREEHHNNQFLKISGAEPHCRRTQRSDDGKSKSSEVIAMTFAEMLFEAINLGSKIKW